MLTAMVTHRVCYSPLRASRTLDVARGTPASYWWTPAGLPPFRGPACGVTSSSTPDCWARRISSLHWHCCSKTICTFAQCVQYAAHNARLPAACSLVVHMEYTCTHTRQRCAVRGRSSLAPSLPRSLVPSLARSLPLLEYLLISSGLAALRCPRPQAGMPTLQAGHPLAERTNRAFP